MAVMVHLPGAQERGGPLHLEEEVSVCSSQTSSGSGAGPQGAALPCESLSGWVLQGQCAQESSLQMLTQFTSEISTELQMHREEQRASGNFRHLENFNIESTDVYGCFLQSHEGLKIIISCLDV